MRRKYKFLIFIETIFVVLLTFFFIGLAVVFILISIYVSNLPSIEIVTENIRGGSTQIYDRKGEVLLYEIGLRQYPVSYEEIPKTVIYSTLAAEDDSFFEHKGVSIKGILRSIILNIKTGSLTYGGSTITQQLARNLFLTQEKSIIRKIKEIILALEIERKFTKEQILTMYLNSINYGAGNIGIKAAADFYFNKNLKDLNWSEAAILASIPKSPKYYSPIYEENLTRLKERRDFILKRLYELGWINYNDYLSAINEPIKISQKKYYKIAAPHFVIEVKKILEKMFPDTNLETAGLKVITTLNYDYQKIAEEVVKDGALKNEKNAGARNASLLMMDAKTGEILVMVGSRDFFDESIQGQVNMTTALRQPGSTFKPISYVTLFQLGYPIETIVFDVPTNFGTPDNPYIPQNFDHKFRGPVNLRIALAQSINVPAVKVFYLAGPERVIENARKFGLTTIRDYKNYGLSLGLGTAEVRMIDLLKAYSVFANDGEVVSQSLILKIYNSKGEIIYEYKPVKERVIDSQPVRMVNDILKDYEARRGLFVRSLPLTKIDDYEIAIKTGTSQFYRDAWTIGYTPEFIVGVWAGNTDGKPVKEGLSTVAALPIWHNFVSKVIKDFPKTKFPPPLPVKVNKILLNGEWISSYGIHSELYFIDRNNPLGPMPANPYNDPQFYNWESAVQSWFNSLGFQFYNLRKIF
jgi:1A family penicillin-binding protein